MQKAASSSSHKAPSGRNDSQNFTLGSTIQFYPDQSFSVQNLPFPLPTVIVTLTLPKDNPVLKQKRAFLEYASDSNVAL